MKTETYTPLHEYAKILASMVAGILLFVFFGLLFLIDKNCFVSHEDAQAKRETYIQATHQMVCPIDEFSGMWEGVYK